MSPHIATNTIRLVIVLKMRDLVVPDQLFLSRGSSLVMELSSRRIHAVVTVDQQRRLVQLCHARDGAIVKVISSLITAYRFQIVGVGGKP